MKKKFERVVSSIKVALIKCGNFIRLHKKQVLLGLGLFLIVFIPTFLYFNLTNPTKINSLIASAVNKGAPSNKYFDDEVFYRAVVDAYNKENKTNLPYTADLTDEQLKNITTLSYSSHTNSEKIISTKGIEKLTSLTDLDLYNNNLSSIDISKNITLVRLNLSYNNLSSIDLSKNTALTDLNLRRNNLISINLSQNTALTKLDLSINNLSSIDVSKNIALTDLCLYYTNLSSIDVSKNIELRSLVLQHNNLNNIEISQNTKLYNLDLSSNNLSSIEIGQNTALIYLDLSSNNLSNIDVSQNTALTHLYLSFNNLSSIDTSQNVALTILRLSSNNLSNIDVSQNTALTELRLSSNNLSSIDVSQNTALIDLYLSSNNLSSIDTSQNVALKYLDLGSNNLSNIDVSQNTALTELRLSSNNLSSIDTSQNVSLKTLYLYDNPLVLEKQRLLKGKSVFSNSISNIKLPEGSDMYFITYEMEDNTIASFSDNKVTGLKSGNTNLVATLNGVKESGSFTSPDLNLNGNILVYDLSSKYNINHDEKYIYVGADSINSSLDNIKLENISGEIEDNKLVLYDGDFKVDEYRLVGIASSTYDFNKDYIYTGTNIFDKSKITCINCTLEESNNTLNIKYGSATLKSYKIVSYLSSTYDLSKDYIYIGINTFDKSKITCTNCTLEESGNTLNIKYGSTILKSYKLVSISSNKYDLSKDNIRLNKDEVFDINSVSVINGTKEYSNNKLYIKYNSDILKVYNITYRLKGDVNNDGKITNADVSKLFAYYKGKIKLTEDDLSVSDLNNDGKITNADVSKLFAYYKGKIKEL